MGNAGAGKTTLANSLFDLCPAPKLFLDEVAFAESAQRRQVTESVEIALAFAVKNNSWIIEGCYTSIVQPLVPYCDTLVFLNPGIETCVTHCRQRPWERKKFNSPEEQNANLENLIAWVRDYTTRTDEYGLLQHRRLFDSFQGRKIEFTRVVPNAAQHIIAADV